MAIEVGDVFHTNAQIDRVKGYAKGKLAVADYHPIPKQSKITVLEIKDDWLTVKFEHHEVGGIEQIHSKGIRLIEKNALLNATNIYDKSTDISLVFRRRIRSLIEKTKQLMKKEVSI